MHYLVIHLTLELSFLALDKSYQHPELFSHVISSGETLHGMIFKPHQMLPGYYKKLVPTWFFDNFGSSSV